MPEWLRKFFNNIRDIWSQWSMMRRAMLIAIVVVIIGAFVILANLSSQPAQALILNSALTDQEMAARISSALDAENIPHTQGADGLFYAADEITAKQARAVLIREDLLPGQLDPWNFFTNMDRWTLTDFDRDINLQRALTNNLEQHIAALNDVDSANVTLVLPETQLFAEDQKPATASVVIQTKPGSDISENRTKIEGIVKLIQFAVEGLESENITILDIRGTVLNDFEGMEDYDRLNITNRMLRQKRALEAQYTATILRSLSNVFSTGRVNIVNLDIDLDFNRKAIETTEHFPVTMVEDNPNTPYSELEVSPSILRSKDVASSNFEGTGFNPEGPPGVEGQTPPAYQDLTNLVGRYNSDRNVENYEVNVRNIREEKSPYEIKRISLGMVIDGTWGFKFDEQGEAVVLPGGDRERVYTPISEDVLVQAREVVEGAIGFSKERGDIVTVENIPFDRSEQFRLEDEEWQRQQQIQRGIIWSILGVLLLLVLLVLLRVILRLIERRRIIQEEQLAREHQMMREKALRNIEKENLETDGSVGDRVRQEMQENARELARENPENVAHLVRSWLNEE